MTPAAKTEWSLKEANAVRPRAAKTVKVSGKEFGIDQGWFLVFLKPSVYYIC